MSRRKGEITSRMIDRDFPYQVVIAIPPGGLGTALEAMHRFCARLACRAHGGGRQQQETMRWCFETPQDAQAFHDVFGGEKRHIERQGLARFVERPW